MERIIKQIYGFFDKNKAITITQKDGSAHRGIILAPDSRMIRLVKRNDSKTIVVISQIKNIKETEKEICAKQG